MRYIAAIKLGLKEILAYRFEVSFWGIIALMHLAVWYFVWSAVFGYAGTTVIRGFTFQQMMGYYIASIAVDHFTFTDVDQDITESVRTGTLFKDIIRPFNIFLTYISQNVGYKILVAITQGIPLALIAIFVVGIKTTPIHFVLFMVSLALAFLLKFSFAYLFGMAAFWLTKTGGLFRIKNGVQKFLAGAVMPLSLFPAGAQAVFAFLPFQYMTFVSVQILLQKYTIAESIIKILIQILWIVIFYAIVSYVWQKARKRFEVVGT